MDFDLTKLVITLIDNYGAVGFSIAFCLYFLKVVMNKLDRLIVLSNKTFGVMLAIAKKDEKYFSEGDGDD